MIRNELLPTPLRTILDSYLMPAIPRAEKDALVLAIFYMFSKILCYERFSLYDDEMQLNHTFPNLYVLLFSESGTGKDRGMRQVNSLLKDFYVSINEEERRYIEAKKVAVDNYIDMNNLKGSKAQEYKDMNYPRMLRMVMDSNATVEGFIDQRRAFQDSGFGCTCFEDSEIFDTIKTLGSKSLELLKYNKEAFDHGDTKAKTIKGDRFSKDVKGVPHLLFLHGAVNRDEKEDLLKTHLNLGMARRVYTCFPPKNAFAKITLVERKMMASKAKEGYGQALNVVNRFISKIKSHRDGGDGQLRPSQFLFTGEARNEYFQYELDCDERAEWVRDSNNEGVTREVAGRPWKTIKLAAIIAAIESEKAQEDIVVSAEHFIKARGITDYYGEQFADFYLRESDCLEKKTTDYIIANNKVSTTQIINSKILQGTYESKKRLATDLLEGNGLTDYLKSIRKVLICEKGEYKDHGKFYSIIDVEEHKELENAKRLEVHYSHAQSNEDHETNFMAGCCPFEELHEIIQMPCKYSASRFKDDYRLGDNWTGDNDLIVFDFDNDGEKEFTIEAARERFRGFTFLIMPTKSHMKPKGKKGIKQRFRLILPTLPMEKLSRPVYGDVIEQIFKNFNLPKGAADLQATKDVAHVWSGNNADPIYNFAKLYNWKVARCDLLTKRNQNEEYNTFDRSVVLTVKKQQMSFEQYISEAKFANGKTVPCCCFRHEDKNPSAFICINRNGNFQFHCTPCGETLYYNL